jgi:hypothetical protein
MREVVIGLVSGLLGAGLSAWVAWVVGVRTLRQNAEHADARRSERLEEQREQRRYDAQVMARVLLSDTVQARVRLRNADRNGVFWSEPFAPSLAAWEEHRNDVARFMPIADWDVVNAWFRKMATLEAYAIVERGESLHSQPRVRDKATFVLRDALRMSLAAAEVLERFTGKEFEDDQVEDEEQA